MVYLPKTTAVTIPKFRSVAFQKTRSCLERANLRQGV